ATSATRAPGARLSWTIRALSSADQRRRRSGPVKSSSRRKPTFASLLTSNIITAPSPIPRESPAQLNQERKNGRRAPLTLEFEFMILHIAEITPPSGQPRRGRVLERRRQIPQAETRNQ